MANQKLTEEEIKSIKDLQSTRNSIIVELGNLEAYLFDLSTKKTGLQGQLSELAVKDQELGKELSDKYGNGSIDLEKEEFIPQDWEEGVSSEDCWYL